MAEVLEGEAVVYASDEIAYINIVRYPRIAKTQSFPASIVNVDYDADGEIVGIEVIW